MQNFIAKKIRYLPRYYALKAIRKGEINTRVAANYKPMFNTFVLVLSSLRSMHDEMLL
jgi:hypothetical protein